MYCSYGAFTRDLLAKRYPIQKSVLSIKQIDGQLWVLSSPCVQSRHLQSDKPKASRTQSTKIVIVAILCHVVQELLVRSTSSQTNCSKFPAEFLVIQRLMSFELVAGRRNKTKFAAFFPCTSIIQLSLRRRQLAFPISCLLLSCPPAAAEEEGNTGKRQLFAVIGSLITFAVTPPKTASSWFIYHH